MSKKSSKRNPKEIAKRVLGEIPDDNIAIVSAGVAFYLYLSIFPAMSAIIALYGLFTSPEQVSQQVSQISSTLPEQVQDFISQQLSSLARASKQSLSLGAAISILLGLWSANNGTRAMFKGVIIAYDEENTRDFLQSTGITLLFTLSGIIVVILSILMIVGFPALVDQLGLPKGLNTLINWGRWLLLGLIAFSSISTVYKYAPLRDNSDFRWLNWGALIATFLWLIGSAGFSLFIEKFGRLDKIFGSVGVIIILMLWFLLSSFCILLGAEVNSELKN